MSAQHTIVYCIFENHNKKHHMLKQLAQFATIAIINAVSSYDRIYKQSVMTVGSPFTIVPSWISVGTPCFWRLCTG